MSMKSAPPSEGGINLKILAGAIFFNVTFLIQALWLIGNYPDRFWYVRLLALPLAAAALGWLGAAFWQKRRGAVSLSRLTRLGGRLSSRRWMAGLCLVLFLSLYLLSMGGIFYSYDDRFRFNTTMALVERGELLIVDKPGKEPEYSKYGIVQPLLTAPLYFLGKQFIDDDPAYERFDRVLSTTLMQFVSAGVCVVMFLFLLDYGYARAPAFLAVAVYGAATMAWPQAKYFFTEPLTALFLLITAWRFLRFNQTGKPFLLFAAGVSLGLGAVNKTLLFVLPTLPVAIYLFWLLWPRPTGKCRTWGRAFFCAGCFLLPMALSALFILWFNDLRYGSPWLTGYEGEFGRISPVYQGGDGFSAPFYMGLFGLLFSSGKGAFFFSPPLAAALAGARRFVARQRPEGLLCLGLALIWLLAYSKWWCWHGGWSWGPRHIFPVLCFACLPLAQIMSDWKDKWWGAKALILALIIAGVGVQILAVSAPFFDYIRETVGSKEMYLYRQLFLPNYSPIAGQIKMIASNERLDFYLLNHRLFLAPLLMMSLVISAQLAWLGLWAGKRNKAVLD